MSESSPMLSQQTAAERINQMQQEIDRLRSELEHSERLSTLGFLAAGTAHEINNVLTPALAYAQLSLSNSNDRDFQAKAMQKVVTGIQTASQIAQAVLGFAGRPDEPHTANVLKTVELSIECIGRDPRKDKVNVAIDVPSNLVVCMRPLALQQVLMNLILNARAALRKRGGAIKITASADQNYAKLVVADNGPGIADHVLSRIFEPFITDSQRSGNNGKGKGTGLGLAICRRLVEEANGTISAQTSAETGTIFTISLPKHAQLRAIA